MELVHYERKQPKYQYMMHKEVISRLVERLFGSKIVVNVSRGELFEEIVAMALEPEWFLCGADFASHDLQHHETGLRIQVKQSAARQSWHSGDQCSRVPSWSISHKMGRWEGSTWIGEPGRYTDLYIFGWHPLIDEMADHREPDQWVYFVVPASVLPHRKSISLSGLQLRAPETRWSNLKRRVDEVTASITD